MRKVGVAESDEDVRLEKRIGTCELHLAGCYRDYENIMETRGQEAALQSPHARGVAQYSHVVDVLRGVLDSEEEDKYKKALEEQARLAVGVLRDAATPDWKRLAVASILEALSDVPC